MLSSEQVHISPPIRPREETTTKVAHDTKQVQRGMSQMILFDIWALRVSPDGKSLQSASKENCNMSCSNWTTQAHIGSDGTHYVDLIHVDNNRVLTITDTNIVEYGYSENTCASNLSRRQISSR